MPQPPTLPVIAHENIRTIPSLSQKTFFTAFSGLAQSFSWEFDLAARITDANQFIGGVATPAAPANSTITPQPAIGPWCDWFVFTSGGTGGTMTMEYAADASPCSYRTMFTTLIGPGNATNASGLRVTGRFVRLTFAVAALGSVVEVGYYIRNT